MKLFALFAFFFLSSNIFAQKEINFNDTNVERKEIEVNKTLQGVLLNTEFLGWTVNQYWKTTYLDMAYFREDRIAPTMTLHTTAGLHHYIYWLYKEKDEYGNDYVSSLGKPKRPYYNVMFQAETAPRWYFVYRHRYVRNRRTDLNSGWFVAVPLQLNVPLLGQPVFSSERWLPRFFSFELYLWTQIGFRYAFTPRFFIESSFSYTPVYAYIPFYRNAYFNMWEGYVKRHEKGDDFYEHFKLELKAAYTF